MVRGFLWCILLILALVGVTEGAPTAVVANTGGGGGGSYVASGVVSAGNGGSGIVIVAYPTPP